MSGAAFAVSFASLYAAHHVGDYWVQTEYQAKHKGAQPIVVKGKVVNPAHVLIGQVACVNHVFTYVMTQSAFLIVGLLVTGVRSPAPWWLVSIALAISGITHYVADRRAPLERLTLLIGKINLWEMGKTRGATVPAWAPLAVAGDLPETVELDNPCLGTGAHALDQAWHIFWGVFVASLLIGAGS